MMYDLAGLTSILAAGVLNQNLPEGIVGLIEIFAVCCLLGGIAAVAICRTRHSFYRRQNGSSFKEVNSTHWADDRNKDAQ